MKKYSKIALTKSKGRIFKESISKYRSPFQRDRDRIVHSASFRRLKHKTQVFVNTEGDHYRTRLTHSMEVAQIARSIARYLELNEDLAETLSLAHDLGHPPFGHAGEVSLNECMEDYGGFDHNLQTLRVVMFLENKYLKYSGLNLSIETLEGLLKHNGPVYELDLVDSLIGVNKFNHKINFETYPSLEAQVLVPIHEKNEFDFHILLVVERLKKRPDYNNLFQKAYNSIPTPNFVTKAIACYERTLISGNSRFDQYYYQNSTFSLSKAELRGMDLFFNKLNCIQCHSGFNFSNGEVVNNGLYTEYKDIGKMRVSLSEKDNGCFKVLTLRNIEITGQ